MLLARALPVLLLLAACEPPSTEPSARIEGRLDADTGHDVPGLGGPSLAQRARRVELCQLESGGVLDCLASANVTDSRFVIAAPASTRAMFVQALDVHGQVLARAIVEGHVDELSRVTLQPLSTASSLQAMVWLEIARTELNDDGIDRAALRLGLDSATALQLKDLAAGDPNEFERDVHAFAMAAQGAQDNAHRFLDSQNVPWREWLDACSAAAITVDRELAEGRFPASEAREALRLRMIEVDAQFAIDPEIAAYRALRTVSAQRIAARTAATDLPGGVIHSYLRSAAELQAQASVSALQMVLQLGRAKRPLMEQADRIDGALLAAVDVAQDDASLVSAFATWREAVRGEATQGQVSTGLLVQLFTGLAADSRTASMLSQVDALGAQLDAMLAASARSGNAGEVGEAWNQFDEDSDRVVLSLFGADDIEEAGVVSLLIHSESSFR